MRLKIKRLWSVLMSVALVFTMLAGIMPGARAADGGEITSFAALPDGVRWQRTSSPDLPDTLAATVDGADTEVSVTWQADHTYDASSMASGLYVFTAHPDSPYTVAEDITFPLITVYVPAGVPQGRMLLTNEGSSSVSLSIQTAAQLSELAGLVNAGKLESLVTGSSTGSVTASLANDIDLSEYGGGYNSGKGWIPIGTDSSAPFKGAFDGGGHTITGLYINDSSLNYCGMFGDLTGSVKNLALEGVQVSGKAETGGVVGQIGLNGRVENCYVTGRVSGAGTFVGGVAGMANGTVQNCYSAAAVGSTSQYVGGVVGAVMSAAVEYCYSTGTVVSSGNNVGGVAGSSNMATVQNCAALNPSVSGGGSVGRVIGGNGGTLSDNYAFSGMTGGGSSNTASGADGADIYALSIEAATFWTNAGNWAGSAWDNTVWTLSDNALPILAGFSGSQDNSIPPYMLAAAIQNPFAGGDGSSGTPYQIKTAAQLAELAALVNADTGNYASASYELIADIDLSSYGSGYNGGKGWRPIGYANATDIKPFKGTFNGLNHTITGLYINDTTALDYVGFFGSINGGTVKNLTLSGVNITGDMAGGVAGGCIGTLQNCVVTGAVNGESEAGGIAGMFSKYDVVGTMQSCAVTAAVSGVNAGGVVGYQDDGTIENCYATGAITCTSTVDNMIGGIVGSQNKGTVQYCYATGTVSGADIYVGGVVGKQDAGTVQYCAALNPSVSGLSSVGRVAGDSNGTLAGNVAYSGMTVTANGAIQPSTDSATGKDGTDTSGGSICATGFFQTLFGGSNTDWTYATGKAPILGGIQANLQDNTLPSYILLAAGKSPFAGGDGSSTPYQISTAAQLAELAALVNAGTAPYPSASYVLTADIDLSGYGSGYDGGRGWTPIGITDIYSFKGSFDGGGYTVTGLYINNSRAYTGLFGYTTGSVENLELTGAQISGGSNTGGVAGVINSTGTVENCCVTGTVSGKICTGGVAGGVAGTVKNCYAACTITSEGGMYGGGVAGDSNGTVENCYATGTVGGDGNIGGIIGDVVDGTMKNCVALNSSVSGSSCGRITGKKDSGTMANNYAFSGMTVNGVLKGSGSGDSKDGLATAAPSVLTAVFWTTASNWSESAWNGTVWTIADGVLPTLKNFSGTQSGMPGLYLTPRTLANTTVSLSESSYTYDGTAHTPGVTVTFGGTPLTQNTDYTYAVTSTDGGGTSAGTTAGTVTITVTGMGGYTGMQTATYAIAKTPLTVTAATVSDKAHDGTTAATVTSVTFGGLISGESLTEGTDYTVSGSFSDANVGTGKTVSVTVTLLNTAKAGNYAAPSVYSATASITDASAPSITTTALPGGTVGTSYGQTLAASGTTPITWSLDTGSSLPDGLSLNTSTGVISGTPTTSGNFTFTVKAENSVGSDTKQLAVEIQAASTGGGSSDSAANTATLTASDGTSGSISVTISGGSVTGMLSAGNASTLAGGGSLTLTMPAVTGAASYGVKLPASGLSGSAGGTLTISTGLGNLSIPSNMLSSISGASGKTAQVTIIQGNTSALSSDVKALIGDRPVIQLSLSLNGIQTEWSNPAAPVTVSIPYIPTAEELKNPNSIVVWYIDGSGRAVCISSGHYDASTGKVTFTTTHFSQYAVGYNNISFTDVSGWYKDYVNYLAARKIINGTGNGCFSPDANITRAEFVTILANLSGNDLSGCTSFAFSDVSTTDWYFKAVQWAYEKGVATGSNGNFDPNANITREQMAVMFYNYAKYAGANVSNVEGMSVREFSDYKSISNWALEPIQWAINNKIISGNGDGSFAPQRGATRAEAAKMIVVLLQGMAK
ncbi:MAG: S-layer homology domain-containing protein [Oscillospiraceae bacterium]|nr:S-layer homology domain-containing protein [Oscillospiraceae bacterium]